MIQSIIPLCLKFGRRMIIDRPPVMFQGSLSESTVVSQAVVDGWITKSCAREGECLPVDVMYEGGGLMQESCVRRVSAWHFYSLMRTSLQTNIES